MTRPRMTLPTALIVNAIARGDRHGFDIMDATGLPSGTVYPALRRLERGGFLASRWEDAKVALDAGRPRRRTYALTQTGVELVATAREKLATLPRFAGGEAWGSSAG